MRLIFSFGYSLFSYGIVSFCDLRSCKYLFRTETIITAEIALEGKELGFGGLTTIIGISMIIYFIWVGILGGFMWKKSMSKRIQKA